MLFTYSIYSVVSFIVGIMYGCFFYLQQRSILMYQNRARALFYFCSRILILGIALFYLLRMTDILSILSVGTFIAAFWLILLSAKAVFHDGK